jgi:integrase/recombinase XerC
MIAAITPAPRHDLQSTTTVADLVAAFLAGRKKTTLEAYRQSLEDFARFLGVASIDDAARILLDRPHGDANHLALTYRASLIERGLSPATTNTRLAAVRSLVKLANVLGVVPWTLQVAGVRARAYRDTRGPGQAGVRSIVVEAARRDDPKGLRDTAIIRLLHDLGLRRGEVVALDVEDIDVDGRTVAVVGKGDTGKTTLTLPEPTARALKAWLDVRGAEPGALFLNADRAGKGRRLTGRSVARIVATLGDRAGVRCRPHGLRHAAITEALDRTGGNVRSVQRFSRHADVRTLQVYDDARADLAGEVAKIVAVGFEEGEGR